MSGEISLHATAGGSRPNRFPQIYGFIGAFTGLATIAIVLRFVSRIKYYRIGYDDYFALLAYLCFLGVVIANIISVQYGFGRHIYEIDFIKVVVPFEKCAFASQVLYHGSQGAIKFSTLLFLARIVSPTLQWRKRLLAVATFVVFQEICFTIAIFLQCRPTNYFWNKHLPAPANCKNQLIIYYTDASVNIATDVLILALPWMIFSGLNIQKSRKYAVLTICSAGVFTLVTSILRIPFLHNISQTHDPTWDVTDIATWTIAELGSAITTASVPTMRPLISSVFPRFMNSSDATSSSLTKPEPIALNTIGGRPIAGSRKTQESKGSQSRGRDLETLGDRESEEYILHDDGRVTRGTSDAPVNRESV